MPRLGDRYEFEGLEHLFRESSDLRPDGRCLLCGGPMFYGMIELLRGPAEDIGFAIAGRDLLCSPKGLVVFRVTET